LRTRLDRKGFSNKIAVPDIVNRRVPVTLTYRAIVDEKGACLIPRQVGIYGVEWGRGPQESPKANTGKRVKLIWSSHFKERTSTGTRANPARR